MILVYALMIKIKPEDIGTGSGWTVGRMDDSREGCFPESYVQPADVVSTDESMVQQPHVDKGEVPAVQAPLVPTWLLVLAACQYGLIYYSSALLSLLLVQLNLCFVIIH